MRAVALIGLAGLATAGLVTPSIAQSAYDYPWCALYGSRAGGGAQSCYYKTYSQCMATMRGIGGTCIRSPYYRGAEVRERRYNRY